MSDLDKGQTGQAKTARNPVKIIPIAPLKKPDWIRVKAGNSQAFYEVKRRLRENNLHTVCEEASCPEHRRMLRQRHGDLHDPRRSVHASLPVLRRRARPAAVHPMHRSPLHLGSDHRRDGVAGTS